MMLTILLFFLATFGMVSAGVVGYYFLVERHALAGEKGQRPEGGIEWVEPSELLKTDSLSTISFWDKLLARFDYVEIMKANLAHAGLNWTVGRLTLLMLLVAAVTLAILAQWVGAPWWVWLPGGALAGLAPYFYILRLSRKRLEKFETQFPEALESLARALRAGHPLAAGLQMLALEGEEPLAGEMRTLVEERSLGSSWDEALDNLARRVPLVEVSTFVAAVKLQNRTGGKLSEVLGRLSETMREAGALRGEIRAIAAHGRMTGRVLTVLPLVIAGIMAVVNPMYLALLWTRPEGQAMIGAAVLCLVAAHFVIRKLVDIRI